MRRIGEALTIVCGIVILCLSGCSNKSQIQASEVTGVWKLDAKNLDAEDYSQDDFSAFSLSINSSGRFVAMGVPHGIFIHDSKKRGQFEGTWLLRYENGYNYIEFRTDNLPGFTSGICGVTFDWKDGHWDIRLNSESNKGFIYITRIKNNG